MFPVLQIWDARALHVTSVCDVVLYWSPTQIALQNDHEVLQKVKVFEWPVLSYSFTPIDYRVIKTVGKTVFDIYNSNHKFLDNQKGDRHVKGMGFMTDLKVYNYDCSMS